MVKGFLVNQFAMIKVQLKNVPTKCSDFLDLDIRWEYVFNVASKVSNLARERRKRRGIGKYPKMRRLVRIWLNESVTEDDLDNCDDIEWWEYEVEDEPLYNPDDPDVTNESSYGWTKLKLVATTGNTAFDTETGTGIVIGVIGSGGSNGGPNYTHAELGGTGNQANDWAAIQAGTHSKIVDYTNPSGTSIDPYGSYGSHEDAVARHAVAVMDNTTAYCGSCPNAKVMAAIGQDFDEAIQRMADLGTDVITVSYTNCYSHRTAIQYAVASGVVVVYAHGSNTHAEIDFPLFEAITVGGFSGTDVSDRSYGEGLVVLGRGVSGSQESWSSPAIAGICGLILANNPTWNVADIYSALIQSTQKPSEMGSSIWHLQYGWGIPNAYESLQLALADLKPLPPLDLAISYSLLTGVVITWDNLAVTNFDHFEVYRTMDAYPVVAKTGIKVYEGSAETYTDAIQGTDTYYYHIIAIDSNGNESDYITSVKESITSTIPTISAVSGYSTVLVTCDEVYQAINYKFQLGEVSEEYSVIRISDTNSYTFSALDEYKTYYVMVIVTTVLGDIYVSEISFTTLRGEDRIITPDVYITEID